ncbi:hypothetical protein GPA10_24835 [Streptomyces sp. p1417]|uniref:Helix-turn-helix domain-containing protein n=1 Tax=Streptomyces typhae TaxID=2681492 RepID=A0A6L6X233_9ACTN|nr:hypothetical protein [Streptomyces typhae]MVO87894.1 hypothetical protein [Streptomyces typhae]
MTAKATKTPPPRRRTHSDIEAEMRRWSPEEVVAKKLLPYTSARVLRRKCNQRQIWHHLDGGRITFTADDLRRENERNAVAPIA